MDRGPFVLLLLVVLPAASCGGGGDEPGPGAGGGAATGSAPGGGSSAWRTALVGTWERGTRVQDNIPFTSEGVGIDFKADGSYRVKTGSTWSSPGGTWSVSSTSITFTGGAAAGKRIALSEVLEGCRVLTFEGATLFRGDVVANCPKKPASLSPAECRLVGTWSRSTDDGTFSTDESVTLEKDRFFRHESGRTRCTTYGTTSKCLRNEVRPAVGSWKLTAGKLTGAPDVTGWDFEPGEGNCGAPTGGGSAGGGTGGMGGGTSATLCTACSGANSCGAGERCSKRRCDAVAGCYPSTGGSCADIDGLSCPDVPIYGACSASSECAASADCVGIGSRPARCLQRCTAASDCVQPAAATASVTMSCNRTSSGEQLCFITCSGPGTCASPMTCRPWSSGNYGYCD